MDGVTLRANVSTIRSVAGEPVMAESLPWLDPSNRDDRLSHHFGIVRSHPRRAVTIVTRDISLQDKADFASLPFVEPPEP